MGSWDYKREKKKWTKRHAKHVDCGQILFFLHQTYLSEMLGEFALHYNAEVAKRVQKRII